MPIRQLWGERSALGNLPLLMTTQSDAVDVSGPFQRARATCGEGRVSSNGSHYKTRCGNDQGCFYDARSRLNLGSILLLTIEHAISSMGFYDAQRVLASGRLRARCALQDHLVEKFFF